MAECIERAVAVKVVLRERKPTNSVAQNRMLSIIQRDLLTMPAADVVPVVRCKDCKHSTLPSELTQRYGKPGTLTCHNRHSPCNRRNVGENDFCSYGEPKEG